jgi:uncharacterized protein (DUF2062 family)
LAKKLFRRFMPDPEAIRHHKSLQFLARWLHDPNLFHLNRFSVSVAVFIGLCAAFIPLPSQMAIAAAVAIWWRANLPISVALVWITNPVTMPPIIFATYKLGTWLLGRVPNQAHQRSFSEWMQQTHGLCDTLGAWQCSGAWLSWLAGGFDQLWQPFLKPFLLGSLTLGLLSGLTGFVLVRILWRVQVTLRWRARLRRLRGDAGQS